MVYGVLIKTCEIFIKTHRSLYSLHLYVYIGMRCTAAARLRDNNLLDSRGTRKGSRRTFKNRSGFPLLTPDPVTLAESRR